MERGGRGVEVAKNGWREWSRGGGMEREVKVEEEGGGIRGV